MKKPRFSICGVAAAAMLMASAAIADDALVPGESILDRARPELDPLGMPVRAFHLYPQVDVNTEYESNIFAQIRDETDDLITSVSPSVALESDWTRHALNILAVSTFAQYEDNEQEDYEDHRVEADLTLDVSSASRLRFSGSFEKGHQERYSPDEAFGIDPTLYKQSRAAAVFLRRVGSVSLRAAASQSSIDFEDVASSNGIINNDDRNRNTFNYSLRAGYTLRPDIDVFLQTEIDRRDYQNKPDDGGVNRDSKDLRVAAGVQGALTGSMYAEILVGYTEREYDDNRLAIDDTPWYQGRLIWNPSGLTTLTVDALRRFNESSVNGASGYTSTRFGVRLDHELRRNFLLHVDAFSITDEYAGISRTDDIYGFEIGARYLMNRYLQVALEARQRDRDSTAANKQDVDFTNNSLMLSIRAQR